ncbi:MAG TPA: hypothetical protein VHA30_00795 [Patescibacteria group bacterium]|nr:hypothetical protein [Patescibacteria group bacterium]
MKKLVRLVWLVCPLAFGQQFIQPNEAIQRLEPQFKDSLALGCVQQQVPDLKFRVTVSGRGEVNKIKPLKPNGLPIHFSVKLYKAFLEKGRLLVLGCRFRPMIYSGRPGPMTTIVTVPCLH